MAGEPGRATISPQAGESMTEQERQVELDYETYKSLLDLWAKENPIKTTKLQVLLAVNALLVSTVNISGGLHPEQWYVYLAGATFSFIWMFSIAGTPAIRASPSSTRRRPSRAPARSSDTSAPSPPSGICSFLPSSLPWSGWE